MRALLDTGSTLNWFISSTCADCRDQGFKNSYSCQQSQSCKDINSDFHQEYGRGQIDGKLVSDSITINDQEVQNIVMALVYKVKDIPKIPVDGLIGMNIG